MRLAPLLTDDLYEEMKVLLMSREVGFEEAIALCCRKKDAHVWSVGKLKDLDGDDVIYFGVDRHSSERRVNIIVNEDDDLHDVEEDEG